MLILTCGFQCQVLRAFHLGGRYHDGAMDKDNLKGVGFVTILNVISFLSRFKFHVEILYIACKAMLSSCL
jgi:hypothetical protein